MARRRFHQLKKVKVRATWNKINLYNLSRLRGESLLRTYYQQKWSAKSISRAYHGEHVREKQWQRMFTPRLKAVVPMDHKYLADNDGSELASGRGSGKDQLLDLEAIKFGKNTIPYMHMTYAPIERRLDMAVWRALFASSARQARQFVTHGMVKVNGKKMPYAGYLLNPGDMFQVDPERVLYATGAPKTLDQVRSGRKLHKAQRRAKKGLRQPKMKKTGIMTITQGSANPTTSSTALAKSQVGIEEVRKQRKLDFRELLVKIEEAQEEKKKTKIGAKRKQELRALAKDVKLARAQVNRKSEKELDGQLKDYIIQFAAIQKRVAPQAAEKEAEPVAQEQPEVTNEEQEQLRLAIIRARENPIDDSKPYATPWQPRPFMSAFAFIPRYLEVNHSICSAVYLRHPVARPGLAEVPTPFGADLQQLAFNWYLRRR